jgi:AraC family transcriptional regulator, transcriptional activator of pobA
MMEITALSSTFPLLNEKQILVARENSISTFDPYKLRSKLINAGGAHFHSYITPAHEVFHINRIEDYIRLVNFPTQTDVQPFRLTVFNFMFLTKGSSLRSKGLIDYEFGENTFFFLPAYEITTHKFMSPDAEGFYCHFNLDILTSDFKLKDLLTEFPFLNFNCHPLVTISEEMREEVILPLLKRLEKEYKQGEKCRNEILRTYLITLFTELKPFVTAGNSSAQSSAYQITEQYKKALSQYIYEKQKVTDYADMLAISPNHLNKCVKSITGQSAHDILSEMILLEAKVLLKQTSMSISEIAYQIGRNELSDFVRFFKCKTGMKPGDYRKMVNPEG